MNTTKATTRTRKPATKAPAPAAAEPTPTPDAPAPAPATAPTPVACGCGCGAMANLGRQYRPGHDARHAGTVARAVLDGADGARQALDALAPKLKAKAEAMIANAERKDAEKKLRAEIRAAAKADLEAKLAAL